MAKKLFEIPIYALRKEVLLERYSIKKAKMIKENDLSHRFRDEPRKIEQIIEIETYPQRNWDYNHISGFIVISKDDKDIRFDLFVPANEIKRYHWDSKEKTFLLDNHLNGYHFRLETMKSEEMLRKTIHEFLDEIIERIVDHRFFVDREAFDQIDQLLDYSKLLNGNV